MSASPKEPPPDDLGATTVDREAMSFEDLEALAKARDADAPSATAEREVVGPKWAGTLPSVAVPASASPAPAPAIVAPAPPVEAAVVAPVEPENLAATSLHQKMQVVPIPTEPAIDELKEDSRVADAGRAAGLRRGSTTADAEDTWLKIGLGVVVVLIVLLVVGVCAGVGSTLLEEPEELGELEE